MGRTRRAVADVSPLLRFRLSSLRGRSRSAAATAGVTAVALTALAMVGPAYAPGAVMGERAGDIRVLLPTGYLAFVVATTLAISVASGGRELLPREEGVAFPVSPTTDHLGALLMAPLNVAWLIQAWSLLAATAYAAGPVGLWATQTTVLAWLWAATALAQLLAWGVEWVRRGRHGSVVLRATMGLLGLGVAVLAASGNVVAALDRSPTVYVLLAALDGRAADRSLWAIGTAALLVCGVGFIAGGAWVAHAVSYRPPREQVRGEGRARTPRPAPPSVHLALVRTDRASIWRSVPLRRGLITLAVLPAVVISTGQAEWHLLPILPGIVAAGGALLFGVNAWCLDGVGALWRESLPVTARTVFRARGRVLVEVLLAVAALPLLAAGLRAGPPTAAEAASLAATVVVVTLQVTARSMHWSVRRPHAADLRSARGAPAPPLAMVTYSAYLSLTCTTTGLLFVLTAQADDAQWALLVAAPLVLLALRRLVATMREWERPDVRARVVATVAAA